MDPVIASLTAALFWGVIVGTLAKRKNRNFLGWGLAGALSWFIALLILFFIPYKCLRCGLSISNNQSKTGVCPSCGSFKDDANEIIENLSEPNPSLELVEGIPKNSETNGIKDNTQITDDDEDNNEKLPRAIRIAISLIIIYVIINYVLGPNNKGRECDKYPRISGAWNECVGKYEYETKWGF